MASIRSLGKKALKKNTYKVILLPLLCCHRFWWFFRDFQAALSNGST